MTPDPRTEEIRERIKAVESLDLAHRASVSGFLMAIDPDPQAALLLHARADLVYLLGRIEALASKAYGIRIGTTPLIDTADDLRAAVDAAPDTDTVVLANVPVRLLRGQYAERDQYRAESDDYRELWEQKCAEVEARDVLLTAAREWRRVEDLVATADEYRGSVKAIVDGNFLMADARSALIAALAALDGAK